MGSQSPDTLDVIRASSHGSLSPADYARLARALPGVRERLEPLRLVLLSTFTTNLLVPYLKVEAARQGFYLDVHQGGFGQMEQALIGEAWRSPDGSPEVLFMMMRFEDLEPDLPYRASAPAFDSMLDRIDASLAQFRSRSSGLAFVANFTFTGPRPASIFDANSEGSMSLALQAFNRRLAGHLASRAHIWDYAGLVASIGSANWTDPRLWALARNPIAAAHQPAVARHFARTLRGAYRPAAKCLVLDLDNTLWGGAIGDDGVGGIQLGNDNPGSMFLEFQRAILGLRDRGVLLAIASKNDEAVAREAFTKHPDMLLRLEHFSAMRIDWRRKSEGLREIAAELNIGLDSLVFFDDNPVEREEVRSNAPQVRVIEVPADPLHFVWALADFEGFDTPAVSREDLGRAAAYKAETERRASASSATSLDEFLVSLEMKAEIGAWNEITAQRIAQLVLKTNQYNLTSRRLTLPQLAAAAESGVGIHWLRLSDRYGDMGLIAVAMMAVEGEDAVIQNLLLSCRVANRGVEQWMLSYLAAEARKARCKRLVGEYVATERNHVVAGLYRDMGFAVLAEEGGVTRYGLDLETQAIQMPAYIAVSVSAASGTEA